MNLMTDIFLPETFGTAVLLLLGGGVVANNILPKNKGNGTGFLMVNWGWGLAVFMGVTVAWKSGGHLNPAVTIGLMCKQMFDGNFGKDGFLNGGQVGVYLIAEFLGAFIGAILCWLAYKKQFDADADPALKLGVFSTGPEARSYGWNVVTEAIGTFVLVFVVILFRTPSLIFAVDPTADPTAATFQTLTMGQSGLLGNLFPLAVALVIVGIGASLGGPTGYAINPARDLSPRIAHALLPIPGKGESDWGYSWVPVVGPIIGGVLAAVASLALM